MPLTDIDPATGNSVPIEGQGPVKRYLVRQSIKQLNAAVRVAKRTYYENVMAKTHSQRIWDLVDWTKPRKDQGMESLRMADGSAALEPNDIAGLFQKQFFPERAPPIDMDFVQSIPQQDE